MSFMIYKDLLEHIDIQVAFWSIHDKSNKFDVYMLPLLLLCLYDLVVAYDMFVGLQS
jgi:hypothetical protein